VVEVAQVERDAAGRDAAAPGMQRADAAQLLAAVPRQDLDDFGFAARRVEARRGESDIAAEIGDRPLAPLNLRLLSKWEPRHNAARPFR